MYTIDGGLNILKTSCTAIIVTMKDASDSRDTPETFIDGVSLMLQLQFTSKNMVHTILPVASFSLFATDESLLIRTLIISY